MRVRRLLLTLCLAGLTAAATASAQDWAGTEDTVDGVVHVRNPSDPMLPTEMVEVDMRYEVLSVDRLEDRPSETS